MQPFKQFIEFKILPTRLPFFATLRIINIKILTYNNINSLMKQKVFTVLQMIYFNITYDERFTSGTN